MKPTRQCQCFDGFEGPGCTQRTEDELKGLCLSQHAIPPWLPSRRKLPKGQAVVRRVHCHN